MTMGRGRRSGDRVARRARHQAIWWIVAARPPAAAIRNERAACRRVACASVRGDQPGHAVILAQLRRCMPERVVHLQEPGAGITLLTFMALPSATWLLHRVLVQRLAARQPLPSRRTRGTS